jgi:N-acetylmuramoyl-L-alanine amidase
MGLLSQGGICRGCGWLGAVAWVGLCCGVCGPVRGWASAIDWASPGVGAGFAVEARGDAPDWDAAVEARRRFETEPARTHTRVEYERVMNGFRAIYRGSPGDAHAAGAVAQVAELFAERGRELGDARSVQAAVAQYEYLAKAYPGDRLAAVALEKALGLLGPGDAEEARRVKAELVEDYPREARRDGVGEVAGGGGGTPTSQKRDVGHPVVVKASADGGPQAGALSVVTGIRHWSTASYTRVAIDLNVAPGETVTYEAARVENPDRIFFDVGHARLAQELVGKSFNVTDDGFLQRVRAAQFSDEVTRVVLDVHHVAEYSAFLLPDPYRLIIDIHGSAGQPVSESASQRGGELAGAQVSEAAAGAVPVPPSARGAVEVSSLPPMPVTDGSASFGLPLRSTDRVGEGKSVAPPRVVIASKPTAARPVPNTVVKSSAETSTEVAAVSALPGVVEATRKPTSKPIAERRGDDGADGEHYVPRSRQKVSDGGEGTARLGDDGAVVGGVSGGGGTPTSQKREVGHPASGAKTGRAGAEVKGEPAQAPAPTADGETSLVRALGLKIGRIVIDAGHGGHDSGTLGAGGIEEKDVVLDVALRLGKLLHDRLGAEVVYTRDDDTFVPLETRTAIANKAQADLFISVHANSSQDAEVSGVEVYYLNFTSDPEAMTVASRENAVSTESVHELSDLVKKIALKDKIDESRELAADVEDSLYAGLRRGSPALKNRGVKKAPFVVLIGANMPSILAEISFVTNPESAEKLETPEYRERVAESLYKGIARYAEGINGARPRGSAVEQAER